MKKKAFSIFLLVALTFCLVVNSAMASETSGTINVGVQTGMEGVVKAAPTVSPAADTYHATQTVTLTAAGATKICYTTDGSTAPSCASATTCTAGTALASGGTVSVTSTTTIKSAACYADASTGPIATSTYTLTCTTSSVTNGTVSAYPDCTITCNSGYVLSGSTCVASGGGIAAGGVTPVSPPQISGITATVTASTAAISWQTDKSASSRVNYGLTSTYGETVSSGVLVTSHSLIITGLTPSMTYHYQIQSTDSAGTTGSYSDRTFTTAAGAVAEVVGTGTVTQAAGGEITATSTEGSTAKVVIPANAVTASTEVTVTPVGKATALVGTVPAGSFMVGGYVYNISATAAGVAVTTFTQPIALTFTYTDAQISGLDETTLIIYRWDVTASQWVVLPSTVNTATNTVTATTTQFSYFVLMGEKIVVPPAEKPISEMTVAELQAKITEILALITQLQTELAKLIGAPQAFTTDLYYGLKANSEVKRLQEFLINKGYLASGFNTGNYLSLTVKAVKAYQTAKGITPVAGYFGPKTRTAVNTDLGVSQ